MSGQMSFARQSHDVFDMGEKEEGTGDLGGEQRDWTAGGPESGERRGSMQGMVWHVLNTRDIRGVLIENLLC